MSAKCDCKDCAFRGMELCEHRKLMDENAKLRDEILKVIAAINELLDLNRDCCDENAKLREAMKPIMDFHAAPAKWLNMDEMYHASFEAVRKAQDVINGISRKDEDISRKGGAE